MQAIKECFMYIGRYVYNALSKFARSIKTMMTIIYIGFAYIMIPLAFFLMTIESVSWEWSAFTAFIGFGSLIIATIRAYKEDKESKASRDRLEKAIIDLVNEIRIDRDKDNTNDSNN